VAKSRAKEKAGEDWRPEFEQAMGESFAECVCPPVPFMNGITDECCEVVRMVAGYQVTPARLAAFRKADIERLSKAFGEYFGTADPSVKQIKEAIALTLARWPVGSLGEKA
jgi:hypothetical protein